MPGSWFALEPKESIQLRQRQKFIIKNSIGLLAIIAVSKALGLLRETIIAGIYGTTNQTDAYFFASGITGLLFPAICTSVSVVFVHQYSVIKNRETNPILLRDYSANILTYGCLATFVLSSIALFVMPVFVRIAAPGFEGETFSLAVFMSRCAIGLFPFLMLHSILSSIMNIERRFLLPQTISLLSNICIILAAIILHKRFGIYALLFGIIAHEIIISIISVVATRDKGIFRFNFKFSCEMKEMIRLIIPVIIGNATFQLAEIVDKVLASFSDAGSVSAITYASTLYGAVPQICFLFIDNIFYPVATDKIVKNNNERVFEIIRKGIDVGVLILVPVTIIAVLFRNEIVGIFYERGSFSHQNTLLVANLLMYYVAGYILSYVDRIYTKVLYGKGANVLVMKSGGLQAVANIAASVVAYHFIGISGIAVGTTLSRLAGLLYLSRGIRKEFPGYSWFRGNKNAKKIIATIPLQLLVAIVLKKVIAVKSDFLCLFVATVVLSLVLIIILRIFKIGFNGREKNESGEGDVE